MNSINGNYWSRCKSVNGVSLFEMIFFEVCGWGH